MQEQCKYPPNFLVHQLLLQHLYVLLAVLVKFWAIGSG